VEEAPDHVEIVTALLATTGALAREATTAPRCPRLRALLRRHILRTGRVSVEQAPDRVEVVAALS
jgi:hypothetical protein